ncbi:MAG: TadE/TadG family type IV pilus assembly protein [Devosia sp.]
MIARLLHFLRNTRGVAAVEFAIILPAMLALYVGAVEVSTLITADRRVTTIAGTVGDLVSRRNATISQAVLDDYFAAAAAIIAPFPTDTLTQVVSCVRVAADGTTSVMWSRSYNGGDAREVGSSYALAPETQMSLLARGGYIIVAEVAYNYSPYIGLVLEGPFPLFQQTIHLPRFAGYISLS